MTPVEALQKQLGNHMTEAQLGALKMRYSNVDMDAGVRYYQAQYGKDAISRLAYDLVKDGEGYRGKTILELSRYIRKNGGHLSGKQEEFINSVTNAAYGQQYGFDSGEQGTLRIILRDYSEILERAQQEGGVTAEVVNADPISAWLYKSLCLDPNTASHKAWETYCHHKDWMPEAVALLYATYTDVPEDAATNNLSRVEDIIRNFILHCSEYDSMKALVSDSVQRWREETEKNEAPQDQDESSEAEVAALCIPSIANMYAKYGQVIESICRGGVPAAKALDITLLNLKSLEDDIKNRYERRFIKHVEELWSITQHRPTMAQGILGTRDILTIYRATSPELFVEALYQYDVAQLCPMLLYICTDENNGNVDAKAVSNALEAIKMCKELAIRTLLEQADEPRLRDALAKDWRSIPYIALHENDGLEKLSSANWEANLNEDFEKDGKLIKHWVENVPGGALIHYSVKKFVQGADCTWGELGWAVYDVVEIGATAVAVLATAPAGGAGGAATKTGMSAFKVAMKSAGKSAAKALAKETAKRAGKLYMKKAANSVEKGAVYRILKATGKKVVKGLRIVEKWGKVTAEKLGRLVQNRKAMMITCSLMFGYEFCMRTYPNLDKIAYGITHDLMRKFIEISKAIGKGAKEALTEAVRESMSISPGVALGRGSISIIALLIAALGVYILVGNRLFSAFFCKRKALS